MKCLPSNKLLLASGTILHDWHAEIVAIRAFNRFLLDQCLLLSTPLSPAAAAASASASTYLRPRLPSDPSIHPFTLRSDVKIHMYCSEAPCGDASMELVMAAQEDATSWTSAAPTVSAPSISANDLSINPDEQNPSALRGRSNFALLGAVRCKPSRPDAPPTLSKSCTDKLALKQAVSLLSSTTSLLISPSNAYIATLVLPASQHVPAACKRAFARTGRLNSLSAAATQGWKEGYRFQAFEVKSTSREFAHSRRSMGLDVTAVASNLSAVWTPVWQETLIGGVLQGRKQMDPRGASRICRRSMWGLGVQIAGVLGVEALKGVLGKRKYADVKADGMLEERRRVKREVTGNGLKGWVRNSGDDEFSLDEMKKI